MKRSLLTISAIALAVLTGCKNENQAIVEQPLFVSTISVDAPVQSQHRAFKGIVVPAEQTPMAFRRAGEVQHVLVKAGDVVKQGQMIAKLDDSKEKQAVNDAEAQYTLAIRQLKRGEDLHARQMISKAELDELTANKELAEATFYNATNQLNYTRLFAPFAGKVSDVFKERFERVAIGEPVLNLYQNDLVYVRIELSDNVLAMVDPNSDSMSYKPRATFSGIDGRFALDYLEHTSEPNAETQTYEMYLTMPQPKTEILPGTSVSVLVDMVKAGIASIDGYSVPVTALQAGGEGNEFFVWKKEGDIVTRVPVMISQVNGNGAIVSSGVSQGDILINSNLRKLREGKHVDVVENNQ
ncbi:efflux RND transporter periplasmic adaptor subunit [Vibrio sp. Vb0301]|uniref:efflux RND transporter periplasmic adaptor subunit n=1 Tax=Vibrio sp. Vb0301 TaxID=3074622 RepID=UPI001DFA9915|nr:efflux RND transporter periplasmic adaptor subunit [Vibrio sp. Vb0301]EGR0026536.1 efflux RND transporter periplasmic adaptor subunit [Vibrio alginolyticus]EGX6961466.1 efflux RND transporter periplasmic adaptor subunit [Vibrio alginolyticus]EJG0478926.1 efflux RND transporter periplasmic adaptor subunit [Vibrio alginolyticus]MDW2009274.1 efflux RND transporter periplasmic adaptor subunit [Vibrio sp. Vb0301]